MDKYKEEVQCQKLIRCAKVTELSNLSKCKLENENEENCTKC